MRLLVSTCYTRILALVLAVALVGCGTSTTPGPVAAEQLVAYPTLTTIAEAPLSIAPISPSSTTTTTPMPPTSTATAIASPTTAATSTTIPTSISVSVPTVVPPPTVAPTPAPSATIAAANYTVLASVSNPRPKGGASVTVTGQLVDAVGKGVAGATMHAVWHVATSTSACDGRTTKSDGRSSCSRKIGRATAGYTVIVDVVFSLGGQKYAGAVSFTPR